MMAMGLRDLPATAVISRNNSEKPACRTPFAATSGHISLATRFATACPTLDKRPGRPSKERVEQTRKKRKRSFLRRPLESPCARVRRKRVPKAQQQGKSPVRSTSVSNVYDSDQLAAGLAEGLRGPQGPWIIA